ncbi:contactin isoform X3 [Dermacentor silvarum]|uniref:contactin isoform X3 n=1 Tax=Dermacentor silvarum TaxID=543639 RepID=UPI002101513C|nr:contactin isoform X3 [Dermacentor silvarum]
MFYIAPQMPTIDAARFGLLCFFFASAVCGQECPRGWVDFGQSCYKFNRSPTRTRDGAEQACQAYNSDLITVNTFEEHHFVIDWLRDHDPQHRRFSTELDRWGLQRVAPGDELAFICEIPKERVSQIHIQERPLDFGYVLTNREDAPRGPDFAEEPNEVIFDLNGRSQTNDTFLRCVAEGNPLPTYKWFKEEYSNDELLNIHIDPLSNGRYTQTDGTLTIHGPDQSLDRGKYHCMAENKHGRILSRSVSLGFGFIGEFNKNRTGDSGKEFWGKSVSCDPPQFNPAVHYFWVRNAFPDFVQEDPRVFVSHDGNLYFSSLEKNDDANYSCNVQSRISSTSRTGPYFHLRVEPASSGQKLLFPNNFPKSFPEAPMAGNDVRLECIAYGYPVPKYNWTRVGGPMPLGAQISSHGRVLLLPHVRVRDLGEYVCIASNDQDSIRKSVTLSLQAMPEFTMPLEHQVADEGSRFTWTCEAFGIPEVEYRWYRNGQTLNTKSSEDMRARYKVDNNVLVIEDLNRADEGMYQCSATNYLGNSFSTAQLRVVKMAPNFAKYPLDTEMYTAEEGIITIPCRPEAAPFPEFTWRRNGDTFTLGGRAKVLNNGYLQIDPVRREDEGNYTCIVKNQYGTASSTGALVVLSLPCSVESPPPKVVATVGSLEELHCHALAPHILDLSYIWLHNDRRIHPYEQPQYGVGYRPGYLVIYNVSFAEAGHYTCIAKTSVGKVFANTELLVIGPPGPPGAVLGHSFNATSGFVEWADGASHGSHITSYAIEGRTNHNATWRELLNVTYVPASKHHRPGRREIQLGNVLSPWSKYEFRVIAANLLGVGQPSDPSLQYNTAVDRPYVAPRTVSGGGGTTGSLTITWTPLSPEEWNSPEVWYRVYYRASGNRSEVRKKDLRRLGNVGLYSVRVGRENYYSPYEVQVQAVNVVGEGPISEPEVIYSAEDVPQVHPFSVYAMPHNSTALNVTWKTLDITRENIGGRLIGHRIRYWRRDQNPLDSLTVLKRGIENWGLIGGLQPNTEYWMAVMAYNKAGSGPESEFSLAKTFKAAPLQTPTSVKVRALSPTSVLVTWQGVEPSVEEECIQGYKVCYWDADQDLKLAKEVCKQLNGEDLEAVVSGLVPGKLYKFRVLSWSFGGDGKMSSPPLEFRIVFKGTGP